MHSESSLKSGRIASRGHSRDSMARMKDSSAISVIRDVPNTSVMSRNSL
jgi:hypothetical protein